MELDLSPDQEILRASIVRFIGERCPTSSIRGLVESETGLPPSYLRDMGDLGAFALLVPGDDGKDGLAGEGLRDLAIIAEERGRALQPGPFVPMNIVVSALARSGSEKQKAEALPDISSGHSVATWAMAASDGWGTHAPVSIAEEGDAFVLSGDAGLVQDGQIADWILVTAGSGVAVHQFLLPATLPGIAVRPLKSHDVSQRFCSLQFDKVTADRSMLLGEPGPLVASEREHEVQVAVVLSVAETVGAMTALFELTRQYALDRIAFGRPIGSFQAVKHQLADLGLALESSLSISAAATQAVQDDDPDAAEIVSMAKAWVSDSGVDLAQGCFQVFGGIGYTWEHDLHLFLRRITMNSLLFGQSDWHRERICSIQGL
jgi:alkylation response protein AidB-like acyl-CoA dehydrogenase